MMDWVIRALPRNYRLHSYHGVKPGDTVSVRGWRHPRSVDERRVRALITGPSQSGVMVLLDAPLKNQQLVDPIDFAWLSGGGRA